MTYKEQQALCVELDDIEHRIAQWREDDERGYDEAIDLLCKAEEEVRRIRLKLMTEWAVAIPVRGGRSLWEESEDA